MKETSPFERFQGFMADWMVLVLRDRENPRIAENFSPDELRAIDDIFKRFTEISDAVENIDLSYAFINGRMPRKRGLKLDAFLMYHITFYLQETYILRERLMSYAKVVMRRKKRAGEPVDSNKYDRLSEMVRASLSAVVDARGTHVHDRSFGDDTLKQLGPYSFLANQQPNEPLWAELARREYAIAKRYWAARLKTNREGLGRVLDAYFGFLHSELVGSRVLRLPSIEPMKSPGSDPG